MVENAASDGFVSNLCGAAFCLPPVGGHLVSTQQEPTINLLTLKDSMAWLSDFDAAWARTSISVVGSLWVENHAHNIISQQEHDVYFADTPFKDISQKVLTYSQYILYTTVVHYVCPIVELNT